MSESNEFIKRTLTDSGIVITDGPDNHYVRTVPNDDKTVVFLREAIALWKSGDIGRFVDIYRAELTLDNFTFEEETMIKCTRFNDNDEVTCLSWIMEDINIEEYRKEEIMMYEKKGSEIRELTAEEKEMLQSKGIDTTDMMHCTNTDGVGSFLNFPPELGDEIYQS